MGNDFGCLFRQKNNVFINIKITISLAQMKSQTNRVSFLSISNDQLLTKILKQFCKDGRVKNVGKKSSRIILKFLEPN
jgi:hypothetical protein